jgi:hypothetical protein
MNRIEGLRCPVCECKADGCTGPGDIDQPGDGDLSVCMYCQSVNYYKEIAGVLILQTVDQQSLEKIRQHKQETWQAIMKLKRVLRVRLIEKQQAYN